MKKPIPIAIIIYAIGAIITAVVYNRFQSENLTVITQLASIAAAIVVAVVVPEKQGV